MNYTQERDQFISLATREGLDLDTARKLLRYATTLQRLATAQCNGDWPYNGDRDRPNAVEFVCVACHGTGNTGGCEHAQCGHTPCAACNGNGKTWARNLVADARWDKGYTVCPKCETSGVHKSAMRYSTEFKARTWQCAGCNTKEENPVELSATTGNLSGEKTWHCPKGCKGFSVISSSAYALQVCPDCRTQELVRALVNKLPCMHGRNREDLGAHCNACPQGLKSITAVFGGDPRGAVLRLNTPSFPYDDHGRNSSYGLYVPPRER